MELKHEIEIEAAPERVWAVLGERFMQVSDWASPINSSCAVGPAEPRVGAMRACSIPQVGPVKAGVVRERLTKFDRGQMSFEYELVEGKPGFVALAVNRWTVVRLEGERALAQSSATLELKGPIKLLGWLIRWQFQAAGARVLEDLKYFVEHERPHPRKLASLPDSGSAGVPARW
jgi:hypothetical protein